MNEQYCFGKIDIYEKGFIEVSDGVRFMHTGQPAIRIQTMKRCIGAGPQRQPIDHVDIPIPQIAELIDVLNRAKKAFADEQQKG